MFLSIFCFLIKLISLNVARSRETWNLWNAVFSPDSGEKKPESGTQKNTNPACPKSMLAEKDKTCYPKHFALFHQSSKTVCTRLYFAQLCLSDCKFQWLKFGTIKNYSFTDNAVILLSWTPLYVFYFFKDFKMTGRKLHYQIITSFWLISPRKSWAEPKLTSLVIILKVLNLQSRFWSLFSDTAWPHFT